MNGLDEKIKNLSKQVVELFIEKGLTLSTAESCTGGGVAAAITSVPGSSQMFNGTVVAYSNEIKSSILRVDPAILTECGAVSSETVVAMACGVRKLMKTDVSISTSGIAGPSGGTAEKPVGLVHFGISDDLGCQFYRFIFDGDRVMVQKESIVFLLETLVLLYSS